MELGIKILLALKKGRPYSYMIPSCILILTALACTIPLLANVAAFILGYDLIFFMKTGCTGFGRFEECGVPVVELGRVLATALVGTISWIFGVMLAFEYKGRKKYIR